MSKEDFNALGDKKYFICAVDTNSNSIFKCPTSKFDKGLINAKNSFDSEKETFIRAAAMDIGGNVGVSNGFCEAGTGGGSSTFVDCATEPSPDGKHCSDNSYCIGSKQI